MKWKIQKKVGSVFILSSLVLALTVSVSAQNVRFVSDLSLGKTGEEVLWLQQRLNSDPDTSVSSSGVGSAGNETNYFGSMTRSAVIRFQEKYRAEILVPIGLSSGTGIVGAQTRAVLNRMAGSSSSSGDVTTAATVVSGYPTISGVTPGSISDPRAIPLVIKGVNFTAQNTVFLSIQDLEMFEASSLDGRTITVFLNSAFIDGMKNLIAKIPENQEGTARTNAVAALKEEFNSTGLDGVYVPAVVFVKNQNGESNKFGIKINILKDETNF